MKRFAKTTLILAFLATGSISLPGCGGGEPPVEDTGVATTIEGTTTTDTPTAIPAVDPGPESTEPAPSPEPTPETP